MIAAVAGSACEGAAQSSDGGPADAATGPCVGGAPGVSAHLTFEMPTFWTPLDHVLRMVTSGGTHDYDVPVSVVQPDGLSGTARIDYPSGTVAGPATLSFYLLGPGVCDRKGSVEFQADPATCVEVELHVEEICGDAGVTDAGSFQQEAGNRHRRAGREVERDGWRGADHPPRAVPQPAAARGLSRRR